VRAGGRTIPSAAWSYPRPRPGFEVIRDHLAFYAGRVDEAWVGDELVQPQAGDFYGGWVTSDIVGPFKGDRGTLGW
jgi:nucleotidyltransferase-like protein